MINKIIVPAFLGIMSILSLGAMGQDQRNQYPPLLSDSYFGVNIGYINYPFSNAHMEPGFRAGSVHVPHTAVRIILFGHHITKYLSAQITYMRPVNWVYYSDVNGDKKNHSVFMNIGGLTLKSQVPFYRNKFSAFGEAGLAVITRSGFKINGTDAVKDANYASIITAAGIQYHLNSKWDFIVHGAWSPPHAKAKQPSTLFLSGGFHLNMRPLPAKAVEKKIKAGFIFPRNLVQAGFVTNEFGYGVNKFVSEGAIPFFWGGQIKVKKGVAIHYEHNIFHARKVFSLDWGASFGYYKTQSSSFYTLSAFPVLRFTLLRTKTTDFYMYYSVAGPAIISRNIIDGTDTGKKFTFQDLMGIGIFTGKKRNINGEIRIGHYSNGNIFPNNPGVMIPLTFNIGYAF